MLQIESVTKQFATKVLLEETSAHLRPGTRVGLVGPNGVGKTTLFRMILGEDSPDEGRSANALDSASDTCRKSWKRLPARRFSMPPIAINTPNTRRNAF